MKRFVAASVAVLFALQPMFALAETVGSAGSDTRVFLLDGSVVEGRLIEQSGALVIVEVDKQIFTFESSDIDYVQTLNSLGTKAQTTTIVEFPYISFLGATAAFGLLSWLQFDTASERDADAKRHEEQGSLEEFDLRARAKDLRDKADRARLWGWSSAVMAGGSLGVALMPKRREVRIFPEVAVDSDGSKRIILAYRHRF